MYRETFYGRHTAQHQLQWRQIKMSSYKSNENIHKKEDGSHYVVSANKALSVTLQWPGNESQIKYTAILRISNRLSIQRLMKIKMGSK